MGIDYHESKNPFNYLKYNKVPVFRELLQKNYEKEEKAKPKFKCSILKCKIETNLPPLIRKNSSTSSSSVITPLRLNSPIIIKEENSESQNIIDITKLSNNLNDSIASSLDSTYGLLPVVTTKKRIRLYGKRMYSFRGEISFLKQDDGFFEQVSVVEPMRAVYKSKVFLLRNIRKTKNNL